MIYSVIGLILDLIGVLLLFRFGILPNNLWDHILMDSGMSDKDIDLHKLASKIALILLITGFSFQLYGSILQNQSNPYKLTQKYNNIELPENKNETSGIVGNLKLKFVNNEISYQLKMKGNINSFTDIDNFIIAFEDKDGFKVSEINIPYSDINDNTTNFLDKDILTLEVKNTQPFKSKNYKLIKKWHLLCRRK